MNISPRQKQILLILLKKEEVLSIHNLAEQIHVSKRTVQREMEGLGSELSSCGLKLKSKTGKGVWLEGSQEAKYGLLEDLEHELGLPVMDREERVQAIAGELLKTNDPRKLYYFANLFRVSESTIGKDMDQAASWMKAYGLTLVRKQGVGVYVEGSETARRQAIRACIKLQNNDSPIPLFPRRETSLEAMDTQNFKYSICGLLDQNILKKVILCLGSIHHPLMERMTDYSYTGMIIHITIAISRILQEEPIQELPDIQERLQNETSYLLARRIVESLEKEFSISIPDMECIYICMHLKGAKMQSVKKSNAQENTDNLFSDYGQTLQLIYRMIDCYDPAIAFSLKRDEEFIEALMSHMRPTLVRLKYHMDITNPLLFQLKESYPEVFEKCRKVAALLEQECNRIIPEAEIGYLVMHFATASLRLSQKHRILRQVHIGVVCASGIGISKLISSRMEQIFKEKVITETYGYDQLKEGLPSHLDFIVTTFKLENLSIDHVLVNPLLLEEHLAEISSKVEYYSSLPEKQTEKNTEQFTSKLDHIACVASNIKYLIENFSLYQIQKGIDFESLVGKIGRLTGKTEADQIQIYRDIMKREQLSTQVMKDFQIALLHAKTTGVTTPVFQVYLPEEGVLTNPYWQGVPCVVLMLLPDDSYYMDNGSILGSLSSKLAENDEFLSILLTKDRIQIQQYLEQLLRKFFIQYIKQI